MTGASRYGSMLLSDVFESLASDRELQPSVYRKNVSQLPGFGKYFPTEELKPQECVHESVIFVGPGEGYAPLHQDGPFTDVSGGHPLKRDNLTTELIGKKYWIIASPEQTQFLYPKYDRGHPSSRIDNLFGSIPLDKFPLLSSCKFFEGVLNPGELLFNPRGWWHTILYLEPSIAIACQFYHPQ